MREIWTVSELNEQIKALLESSFEFLWVEGEVSNLRRPASGHSYFTLKDQRSQIRAVLFRTATKPSFSLEDGMQVACRARLTAYAPRGEYQLIVERVEPRGLGALQKAFEQLKDKLQAEGLFDARHKKPLPFLPRGIGVITSPTGAVIRDILQVTGRRFPSVPILIAPARVQGAEAAAEIVRALALLNGECGACEENAAIEDLEVIIVARGGGSLEDLHPFNTEETARAVFRSRLPVISAVGHETDFTITDFVADLRAPTPSAAAEMAVPDREDLRRQLGAAFGRLLQARRRRTERWRERIEAAAGRLKSPDRVLADRRLLLDDYRERLSLALNRRLDARRQDLRYLRTRLDHGRPVVASDRIRGNLAHQRQRLVAGIGLFLQRQRAFMDRQGAGLQALNPLGVLRRGYSITRRRPDGLIVKRAADLVVGDRLSVRLAEGEIHARVEVAAPEEKRESGALF
ncbi:MAG: exodeoxyribonuclease VII large subunit [Pseudomonadota bacterium]|nr:exodeoxyribonuclease VII large subunit [Pseudomonadota bacterium]